MSRGDDDRDRTARRRAAADELLRRRLAERRQTGGDGDDGAGVGDDATVPRRRDRGPAPLSFAQERLWFLDRLQPHSAFYNIPMVLELKGDLDAGRLNRALFALARRHDTLRTRIETREEDGRVRPVQVVEALADLPRAPWRTLPGLDLSGLPPAAADAELNRLARDDARRPFSLAAAPLCRYALVRLGPRHHDLLTNHHHVVYDGWSGGVFLRELAALYVALGEGGDGASVLPDLPIQYADFAVWQRAFLQGGELERQLAYWRRRLDGAPALLELPTDRPRPALQSYRGGQVPLRWNAELSAAVERRAQDLSASPFMLLLAVWKVLLARLSGQRDVVVGTPVANRRRVELEHLIGFFANTLALRTDLAGAGGAEPSFREVVRRLRDHVLDDFSHQDLPFEELVAELKVQRNLSHGPVFQVMFTLQNDPARPPVVPGLDLRRLSAHSATAKFDLSLGVTRGEVGFHGGAEYNRDLFDRTTVERWLGHLETLLAAAVAAPETALGELPLLTAAERRAVVAGWNDTGRRYDAPELLHALVERQVDATPDAPALRFRDEVLTYRQFDERANRLTRYLLRRGVGPEVRVGVAMERSVELVLALHAVVKAGGCYVPVDPGYPAERVRFMLEDALGDGGVLLTREALRGELEPALPPGVELLAVDALAAELAALSADRPAVALDPENAVYAIYTSGSTGRPKGAVNRHRAIVNRLLWMQETFRLGAGDRVLQKTPVSFDVSVWELFWPLLAGAELVVAEPGGHHDPGYLVRTVRDEAITTVHFVPSMLQVFLGEPAVGECGAALRRVICSGEALPPDLVRRFHRELGGGGGERGGGPRLFNLYGPTEAAVDVTWTPCDDPDPRRVTLGRPLANTRMHVVDRRLRPQPVGVTGELLIGGVQLARGYLGRPALTADRFVPDPFAAEPGAEAGGRVYRTGDLGRYLADGEIEYLGRLDHQVKVRGLRIELGEIESSLAAHPAVREAVVLARGDGADTRLVAFLVPAQRPAPAPAALRDHLRRHLPEHMVPTGLVVLDEMPLSPNGKADRKALAALDPAAPGTPAAASPAPPPGGSLERRLGKLWGRVLGHERFSIDDNFFDVGGHSLLAVQVQRDLRRALDVEVEVVDLFRFPTLRSLADHLRRAGAEEATGPVPAVPHGGTPAAGGKVAVIGMAGRFPGAPDLDALWANLRDEVESVRHYGLDEMRSFGVPEEQLSHPDFVPVGAELEGADLFDADYFGYAPREAQIIDPQQRLFLEVAVAALEDAGLDPGRYGGRVGVFGGAAENRHVFRIAADRALLRAVGAYQVLLANRADYLPTRVAYKLGLTGPAVNVQTACSTSLVAVHMACRALVDGDCDTALAGGVSVGGLTPGGYVWEKGGIASPDGHTRVFDAEGRGTVRGHGVGAVVLKRLEDALADGDPIRAVVAGTAVNNDGKGKVGFTAPSVDGQERVIADAQRRAGVGGGEIDYVEAHGTATELGDPIEVAALRRAFAGAGLEPGSVALGSVKSNLGHLDAAAGVTGLIKTVLALEHATLPASLHFRTPNPKLDLPASPFRVVAETGPWPAADGRPRRAGVSSFGVGGTNAHAVVEEAPPRTARDGGADAPAAPAAVCLPLSARTPAALDATRARLADWLQERPGLTAVELADAAWTLQHGRRELEQRTAVVAADREGALAALRGAAGEAHGPRARRWQGEAAGRPEVVFLLSGQGSQYPGMARGLYDDLPAFRETFERCRAGLAPHLDADLAELVFSDGDGAAARLERTACAQPALFAVEMAVAAVWRACGIRPAALLGHSLGEYAAACLAGVFELDAALELVAERGRLMEAMEPGSMLAVARPESEVLELLAAGDGVELAAVNGPDACVVAGPTPALEAWRTEMEAQGIEVRPLHTSHAFHTAAMEPALEPFRRAVERAGPRPPRIPLLSNLTGGWMSAAEATDPDTWVRHLRSPVRFGDGAAALLEAPDRVLLEVGPGRALATLVRRRPEAAGRGVLTSLRHPRDGRDESGSDLGHLLAAVGRLWIAGAGVDWAPLAGEGRRKLRLPTYPFQRQSYWVDDPRPGATPSDGTAAAPPAVAGAPTAGGGAASSADGAAAGGLEELLAATWRDLLGRDGIGRHDDFFELGGSSLLAVRLASRLRDRLAVDLDPHELLEHATVARLAAHLAAARPDLADASGEGGARKAGSQASPDPLLVCMQPRGDGAPLVFIHPAGGHNLTYRHVVRGLGAGRPVWAFRAQGLEEGEGVLRRVEESAERYLGPLRELRPQGPYHLVGSSFGGSVAWEMARRLSDDGATVGSLVLVDTFGPGQLPPRDLVKLPEEGFDTELFGGARREELPDLRRIRAVMAAAVEAMYVYEPPPWAGRATFFRASERSHPDEPAHPERAWVGRAAGGLEVHVLPGGHNSMLRPPHAEVVAARLADVVARSEKSSPACPASRRAAHSTK